MLAQDRVASLEETEEKKRKTSKSRYQDYLGKNNNKTLAYTATNATARICINCGQIANFGTGSDQPFRHILIPNFDSISSRVPAVAQGRVEPVLTTKFID